MNPVETLALLLVLPLCVDSFCADVARVSQISLASTKSIHAAICIRFPSRTHPASKIQMMSGRWTSFLSLPAKDFPSSRCHSDMGSHTHRRSFCRCGYRQVPSR